MLSQLLIALSVPLCYWFYAVKAGVIPKISSVFALVLATAIHPTSYARTLGVTLFICMIGDIFIELDFTDETDQSFLLGLVTFLIGHIGFVLAFAQKLTTGGMVSIPFVGCFYVYLMSRLYPNIEADMKIPVLVYGLVICAMGFSAINRFFSNTSTSASRTFSLIGALSFVLSDSLLGIDRFDVTLGNAKFIVFFTYYLALVFVCLSALSDTPAKVTKKTK